MAQAVFVASMGQKPLQKQHCYTAAAVKELPALLVSSARALLQCQQDIGACKIPLAGYLLRSCTCLPILWPGTAVVLDESTAGGILLAKALSFSVSAVQHHVQKLCSPLLHSSCSTSIDCIALARQEREFQLTTDPLQFLPPQLLLYAS